MMEDDIRKPVQEKKSSSAPVTVGVHPPAGELTCSEGQVEDLLAEGESTESEEADDSGESQQPSASSAAKQKSSSSAKSGRQ